MPYHLTYSNMWHSHRTNTCIFALWLIWWYKDRIYEFICKNYSQESETFWCIRFTTFSSLLDHLQMLNYHKNKHERKISSRNSPVTVKNHNCFFLSIKLCSLAPYPTCIPRGKSLHMQLYLENDKLLGEWSLGLSTKKYMYR